ncbi:hypothetical protein [Actinoplanes sp. NPDC049316]|uniref:hypothetical protein n=1 Tax=Actinoplanes sp. NPDC049316 TaxID=3154727 RepID=UPI00341E74DA
MSEYLTSILDTVGLLFVALGLGFVAGTLVDADLDAYGGGVFFLVAGVVILAGSMLAAYQRRPRRRPDGEGL